MRFPLDFWTMPSVVRKSEVINGNLSNEMISPKQFAYLKRKQVEEIRQKDRELELETQYLHNASTDHEATALELFQDRQVVDRKLKYVAHELDDIQKEIILILPKVEGEPERYRIHRESVYSEQCDLRRKLKLYTEQGQCLDRGIRQYERHAAEKRDKASFLHVKRHILIRKAYELESQIMDDGEEVQPGLVEALSSKFHGMVCGE